MKNINFNYVNDLFLDIFTEVVNGVDFKLNEKLTEMHNFGFLEEYYRDSDGELDVRSDPVISCSRFDNTHVQSIEYDIKQIEDGLFVISGKAVVKYNLTALKRVYITGGYDEEMELKWGPDEVEYELTDGSDRDEATISFEITLGPSHDYDGNEVLSEYDFDLNVY